MSKIIPIIIELKRAASSGLEDENGSLQDKSVGLCDALTIMLGSFLVINLKKQAMAEQGKGRRNQSSNSTSSNEKTVCTLYSLYTIGPCT